MCVRQHGGAGGDGHLECGRYECALVVGAEVLRNVGGKEAGLRLGAAAWAGREVVDEPFPWPAMFGRIGEEYAKRYGLDHAHLGRIAEINFTNARRNPRAQTRDWKMTKESFYEDDELNPVVFWPASSSRLQPNHPRFRRGRTCLAPLRREVGA